MESEKESQPRTRSFRWIWWTAGSLAAVVAALGAALVIIAHNAEPYLRARIVDGLSNHFHSKVELDNFHVQVGNTFRGEWGIWAQGHGLRIWPPAEVAGVTVPSGTRPLISLAEFSFQAPLRYHSGVPLSISVVRVKGLEVHMPPHPHFLHVPLSQTVAPASPPPASAPVPVRFSIGSVDCTDVTIVHESSKPGKLPLDIAISHLRVTQISPNKAMKFVADLTNPRPTGAIHTSGTFGPWDIGDPGESPVAGDYNFTHADLSNFHGIAGILSSTGRYAGTLNNIDAEGDTDTPDFRLSRSDNTLDLKTHFHARVDGTNGDTWLDPVDANLGHTHIVARGQVVRVLAPVVAGPPHSIGHDIDLKIAMDRGRVEDVIRISTKGSTPPLTGDLVLNSTLHIPPGAATVLERIAMDGKFTLNDVQFSSPKVQDRIAELSLRGQGRPKEVHSTDAQSIMSSMESDFTVASGRIHLPDLDYTVPGADIQLKGSYGLVEGDLDFTGTAKMQASVSKMVGGFKGFLLKPADRFFKGKDKDAGTEVPVHVDGTREHPDFGVDIKGMKHTSPQNPADMPQTHPESPAQQTPPQ